MNKVVNYIKYCGGEIVTDNPDSKYFLLNNKLIRVSNHIGLNSSGNIQIICTKNNYLLYNKTTGAIDCISYDDIKCFIRNVHLISTMDVNADKSQDFIDTYYKEDFKRADFTPAQIHNIESFLKTNKSSKKT